MLEEFSVTITPLGRERRLRIYLPDGYAASSRAYPVLYMHDGQNLYRDEEASYGMSWGIAEYLDSRALDLIVVGIDSSTEGLQRLDEYAPWPNPDLTRRLFGESVTNGFGGEGRAYVDWIVQELKPLIATRYRTLPDQTGMAGSSMGGLISTYAALAYPRVFRRVAAVSSAYWFNQGEIEGLIETSDLSAIERFYMDVGTNEWTLAIDPETYIQSSKSVYPLLRQKIERIRFDLIEGAEHNERAWRQRLPALFGFLYGDML